MQSVVFLFASEDSPLGFCYFFVYFEVAGFNLRAVKGAIIACDSRAG